MSSRDQHTDSTNITAVEGAEDMPQRGSWWRLCLTFRALLWGQRFLLVGAYLCTLLTIGAGLLAPWPLQVIIDHIATGRTLPDAFAGLTGKLPDVFQGLAGGVSSEGLVLLMTLVFVVMTMVDAIAGALQKVINARVRERMALALRDRMLGHLQTLPPTIRTMHRSGELVLRLVSDVDLFVRLQTKTLPTIFEYTLNAVGILAVMFWLQPFLGCLGLAIIPIMCILARRYGVQLSTASRRKRRREGEIAGLAQEIVRGLPIIQALGREQLARQQFEQLNVKGLQAGVDETRLGAHMERSLQIAQGLAIALVTGGGALLVLQGHLTLGTLTVVITYMTRLLKPVEKINELASTVTRAVAGGERLLALLEHKPAVQDAPGALNLGRAQGRLEFRDVWFTYPDPARLNTPVLRGAQLRLEPGQLAVLIGPSGAGKSTLLSLLVRLFDPSSGEILLDGHPLPHLTLRSLRAQIAVMTQETHLFAGPLRAILTPQEEDVSTEKLWEALAFVGLDDFVRALPEQLESLLGEDGLNLSGGQRQRLSLARAFLLDRPILLLDEPLANVDAVSESIILDALAHLRVGRTCLVVTHRLSLLDYADVVYRLEDGHIVEQDRHLLSHSH